MKNFKIKIPEPCHEGWEKMTSNEKGRFCDSCSKTVVDFTKKTTEEIKGYFVENKGNRICGHFKKTQLDSIVIQIPNEILKNKLSFQKIFILALLLTMGSILFSCKTDNGRQQKIERIELLKDEYRFNEDGYDKEGYDEYGYDIDGYDQDGYDQDGYDIDGYNVDYYNENGIDIYGYDKNGIEEEFLEGEVLYIPENPPKYEEIKIKITNLLNRNFKKEIRSKSVHVDISTYSQGKTAEIYVNAINEKIEQKIKSELKRNILPFIIIEAKKNKEYENYEWTYKLIF